MFSFLKSGFKKLWCLASGRARLWRPSLGMGAGTRPLAFTVALLLALLALPMMIVPVQVQASVDSAVYTVTFQGNWTTASTPGGVVGSAHFTTLIGAVHNDRVTFWEPGGKATAGVEYVAELGHTGMFESEINANSNAVSVIRKSVARGGTGRATFEVTVSRDYPVVTLLSMIGPSPDWFVGISGQSLLDAQGEWESRLEIDLFPYDAGTEEGTEFSLNNPATFPQGVITSIKGMGKFSNVRMARLTFVLSSVSLEDGSAMEGSPVQFTAKLPQAVDSDVILSWITGDDDTAGANRATAGTDYTAVTNGSVTIMAGQTEATFSVETAQDTDTEGDETFAVMVTGSSLPPGVVVPENTRAVGTIKDDDEVEEDPSNFSEANLEGRRLTLNETGEDGTSRSLKLRFGSGLRFEQALSVEEAGMTADRGGRYAYQHSGPGMGRLRLDYDDGISCDVRLSFSGRGVGTFGYDCSDGNHGEGSFRLTTGSAFVPVILSSAGRNNSFFASELSLTNRGDQETKLNYTYTAHIGEGSGTASAVIGAGRQKIEPDAVAYLRRLGVPIPESGNRIGTLRVEVPIGSDVRVMVRTTTAVPEGRAGLAYPGIPEEEGFEEGVYLCGLRQDDRDRSNVAFQNMGVWEEGPITLRTTVYSGDVGGPDPRVLQDVTLGPGEFHQYSGVLGRVANGYVKVERVEGTAPFYAYGVINDQANSDGSFVFPVTASSLEGTSGQTLPVIIETGVFASELTVTNFSQETRTLHFRFVAKGVGTANFTLMPMRLEAGEQRIVYAIVDALRRQEVEGIGPAGRVYAGAVFATEDGGDMSGIAIGARTGSEGAVGSYGVFYNAVPYGAAFGASAWIDALQQNEVNRSNLALVNTGEIDGSESIFSLEIYDGETGLLDATVTTEAVPARGWHQIDSILRNHTLGTRQGYVRVRKISGKNPFLAYGVVNDGGAPGQRSGDGAYVPARE